jgi:hypothetical protein
MNKATFSALAFIAIATTAHAQTGTHNWDTNLDDISSPTQANQTPAPGAQTPNDQVRTPKSPIKTPNDQVRTPTSTTKTPNTQFQAPDSAPPAYSARTLFPQTPVRRVLFPQTPHTTVHATPATPVARSANPRHQGDAPAEGARRRLYFAAH